MGTAVISAKVFRGGPFSGEIPLIRQTADESQECVGTLQIEIETEDAKRTDLKPAPTYEPPAVTTPADVLPPVHKESPTERPCATRDPFNPAVVALEQDTAEIHDGAIIGTSILREGENREHVFADSANGATPKPGILGACFCCERPPPNLSSS